MYSPPAALPYELMRAQQRLTQHTQQQQQQQQPHPSHTHTHTSQTQHDSDSRRDIDHAATASAAAAAPVAPLFVGRWTLDAADADATERSTPLSPLSHPSAHFGSGVLWMNHSMQPAQQPPLPHQYSPVDTSRVPLDTDRPRDHDGGETALETRSEFVSLDRGDEIMDHADAEQIEAAQRAAREALRLQAEAVQQSLHEADVAALQAAHAKQLSLLQQAAFAAAEANVLANEQHSIAYSPSAEASDPADESASDPSHPPMEPLQLPVSLGVDSSVPLDTPSRSPPVTASPPSLSGLHSPVLSALRPPPRMILESYSAIPTAATSVAPSAATSPRQHAITISAHHLLPPQQMRRPPTRNAYSTSNTPRADAPPFLANGLRSPQQQQQQPPQEAAQHVAAGPTSPLPGASPSSDSTAADLALLTTEFHALQSRVQHLKDQHAQDTALLQAAHQEDLALMRRKQAAENSAWKDAQTKLFVEWWARINYQQLQAVASGKLGPGGWEIEPPAALLASSSDGASVPGSVAPPLAAPDEAPVSKLAIALSQSQAHNDELQQRMEEILRDVAASFPLPGTVAPSEPGSPLGSGRRRTSSGGPRGYSSASGSMTPNVALYPSPSPALMSTLQSLLASRSAEVASLRRSLGESQEAAAFAAKGAAKETAELRSNIAAARADVERFQASLLALHSAHALCAPALESSQSTRASLAAALEQSQQALDRATESWKQRELTHAAREAKWRSELKFYAASYAELSTKMDAVLAAATQKDEQLLRTKQETDAQYDKYEAEIASLQHQLQSAHFASATAVADRERAHADQLRSSEMTLSNTHLGQMAQLEATFSAIHHQEMQLQQQQASMQMQQLDADKAALSRRAAVALCLCVARTSRRAALSHALLHWMRTHLTLRVNEEYVKGLKQGVETTHADSKRGSQRATTHDSHPPTPDEQSSSGERSPYASSSSSRNSVSHASFRSLSPSQLRPRSIRHSGVEQLAAVLSRIRLQCLGSAMDSWRSVITFERYKLKLEQQHGQAERDTHTHGGGGSRVNPRAAALRTVPPVLQSPSTVLFGSPPPPASIRSSSLSRQLPSPSISARSSASASIPASPTLSSLSRGSQSTAPTSPQPRSAERRVSFESSNLSLVPPSLPTSPDSSLASSLPSSGPQSLPGSAPMSRPITPGQMHDKLAFEQLHTLQAHITQQQQHQQPRPSTHPQAHPPRAGSIGELHAILSPSAAVSAVDLPSSSPVPPVPSSSLPYPVRAPSPSPSPVSPSSVLSGSEQSFHASLLAAQQLAARFLQPMPNGQLAAPNPARRPGSSSSSSVHSTASAPAAGAHTHRRDAAPPHRHSDAASPSASALAPAPAPAHSVGLELRQLLMQQQQGLLAAANTMQRATHAHAHDASASAAASPAARGYAPGAAAAAAAVMAPPPPQPFLASTAAHSATLNGTHASPTARAGARKRASSAHRFRTPTSASGPLLYSPSMHADDLMLPPQTRKAPLDQGRKKQTQQPHEMFASAQRAHARR